MTLQKKTPLSENKMTTVAGLLTLVGGFAIQTLPSNVRINCIEAIQGGDNPVLVGSMLATGIFCLILGPSLATKNKRS